MCNDGEVSDAVSLPVLPESLIRMHVYFSLTFLDDRMLFPILEPIVFIGENLGPGEEGRLYFQDLESYRQGHRFDQQAMPDSARVFVATRGQIKHVFELENAVRVLVDCVARRRGLTEKAGPESP